MANWFLDMIRDSTPRGQMELRQEMQNRRRDEYLAAAEQFGQVMPEGQMGPPAAYSNANPGGISPEFAMRVAAIPGYQQLGAQMLDMSQRRNIMADERAYLANNMPLVDRERLDQQQRQFEATLAEQQRQWGSISPFAQRQLGLQEKESAARIAAANRAAAAAERGALGNVYGAPGTKEYASDLETLQGAVGGVKAIDRLTELWNSTPLGFGKEAMGAAEAQRAIIMGTLAKLQGAGALQEGDVKRYGDLLSEPGVLNIVLGKGATKRNATLRELRTILQQQVDNVIERNPNLPGVKAPPGFDRAGAR